ncbi:unnamed protein product [Candidula unifasciata]|uniref:Uncharacterized protein n=1 Tax=Candidula unifasciata TaxID=100452 RepID=A0A8S3ZF79_9EUPU|nr:unnamed protein product [Candidula unifasciata]
MEDIDVDCADYFKSPVVSKKHTAFDQPEDDSLGYFSGELNTASLNLKDDMSGQTRLIENSEPRVFSLESSLSKLNISSSCKSDSDQCDSGVVVEKPFESTDSVTKPESCHWVSTHFSSDQILDIFRGDEDGDK